MTEEARVIERLVPGRYAKRPGVELATSHRTGVNPSL